GARPDLVRGTCARLYRDRRSELGASALICQAQEVLLEDVLVFSVVEPHLVCGAGAGIDFLERSDAALRLAFGGVGHTLAQHDKFASIGGLAELLGRTLEATPHEYRVSRRDGVRAVIEAGARCLVSDWVTDV